MVGRGAPECCRPSHSGRRLMWEFIGYILLVIYVIGACVTFYVATIPEDELDAEELEEIRQELIDEGINLLPGDLSPLEEFLVAFFMAIAWPFLLFT